LLSQTCGLPVRTRLRGRVRLVASPVHDLPDCPPGHYYSHFVVRRHDPRDDPCDFAADVLAYNEAVSHSGWAAPQIWAGARGFAFDRVLGTGAHAASGRAVAEGRADIAAIDALSLRLIARHEGYAGGLRIIGRTDPSPAPPYITAMTQDPAPIRAALAAAVGALSVRDREALGLVGLVQLDDKTYHAVPTPASPAAREEATT
jgi:ABC-type phosphate/phosphonate transport system substrate-binding protein